MDLTDFLISGETDNGTTAVLDADTVGSAGGLLRRPRRAARAAAAVLITVGGSERRLRGQRVSGCSLALADALHLVT